MPKEPITLHDDGTTNNFDEDSERFAPHNRKWRLLGFFLLLTSMVLSLWGMLELTSWIMMRMK